MRRQQLLEELVKPLPKDRLHCNKKLLAITESDDGSLTLHFEDGGTFQTDAVIGCDGYRSKIRSIILGDHHPAVAPVFAGFWDARGLLPTSKAIETFGTSVINPGDTNLSACVGNGCMTLSGQISGGEMYFVTVSGIAPEGWDSTSWKTDMHREHLEKAYAGWDQKFRTGVIDCVTSSGPGVIFNQWQSQQAPTYFRGRICMMGDAAHATSNWLGQGAAMAVEDCSVLVSLFELASRPEDLETAFDAFDRVRRIGGRPAMVIEQSRLLGQILTGQKGMGPTDVQHYGIQAKRQEILSYDVRQQLKDAQETFQRLKRGG
ncbi:FAD-dependent monooxygenase eupB [Pseudocercospora fuligena]|uniref:FAD-dependent monooxygenase eupB n=1 Tax=Pseudocercospora fuligena TaxID=685502 RepID=A0A8H6VP87_9PEZI|nr:FAD-dependent monooxygenase eupB [Pseudocercospora fuligena]